MELSKQESSSSAGEYQADEQAGVARSAGDYHADEQAGVPEQYVICLFDLFQDFRSC